MADINTSSYSDLFYEMRGPLQKLFPLKHVLSSELKRDTSMENFSGNQVRVPLILNQLQGGGGVAEGGTVNKAQRLRTGQAHIGIAELVFPIELTKRVRRQSIDNAAAKAAALAVKSAREGLARIENEMMNGAGDALLCNVTGAGGSPGLVVPVGTAVNWRYLYPGRIVDVKVRATGADPGQGLTRRIASVQKAAGTVTFDTASFGGGSGNITFSANEGIYIDGSKGNSLQSIQQIGATTGTFQDVDKAVVTEWAGTDGRSGDATTKPLTIPMLDAGVAALGERTDVDFGDEYFGIGDPKAIDLYKQGLYAQSEWAGDQVELETGWKGVAYNGRPLIKEFDHEISALSWIHKASLQMYGFGEGLPDFDEDTGSMWQRFGRTLNVEAWLYDAAQLGAHRCDTLVRFRNLTRAP